MTNNNLAYYVYVENINQHKIEKYNVLNDGIITKIVERTKMIVNKEAFAEEVELILRFYYWSRCEWEIILTEWPARVTYDEILRLNNEADSFKREHNHEPYTLSTKLRIYEKVDVFKQVKLNWELFIDYLWNNLKEG